MYGLRTCVVVTMVVVGYTYYDLLPEAIFYLLETYLAFAVVILLPWQPYKWCTSKV